MAGLPSLSGRSGRGRATRRRPAARRAAGRRQRWRRPRRGGGAWRSAQILPAWRSLEATAKRRRSNGSGREREHALAVGAMAGRGRCGWLREGVTGEEVSGCGSKSWLSLAPRERPIQTFSGSQQIHMKWAYGSLATRPNKKPNRPKLCYGSKEPNTLYIPMTITCFLFHSPIIMLLARDDRMNAITINRPSQTHFQSLSFDTSCSAVVYFAHITPPREEKVLYIQTLFSYIKIQKLFKILHHIKSYSICMEY